MHRFLPLCFAACVVPCAFAQLSNGPAPPPSTIPAPLPPAQRAQSFVPASGQAGQSAPAPSQSVVVEAESDGKCRDVRPGDTVNFGLTIEGVEGAKSVYADLQLREGRSVPVRTGGLPLADYRTLAGGGLGVRDPQTSSLYRFSLRVPVQIYSGLYHGAGVAVNADRPVTLKDRDRAVQITRHTRDAVKGYCLHVISGFGVEERPVVTDFQPGSVERPSALPGPLPSDGSAPR